MKNNMDKFDDNERYCPKLGQFVKFSYCRIEKLDKPCDKIAFCWENKAEIKDFIKKNFQIDKSKDLSNNGKTKVNLIFDIINKFS